LGGARQKSKAHREKLSYWNRFELGGFKKEKPKAKKGGQGNSIPEGRLKKEKRTYRQLCSGEAK